MIVEHQLTVVDVAQFKRVYARWRWVAFWSVLGAIGFVTAIDHPPVAISARIEGVDGVLIWRRGVDAPHGFCCGLMCEEPLGAMGFCDVCDE